MLKRHCLYGKDIELLCSAIFYFRFRISQRDHICSQQLLDLMGLIESILSLRVSRFQFYAFVAISYTSLSDIYYFLHTYFLM